MAKAVSTESQANWVKAEDMNDGNRIKSAAMPSTDQMKKCFALKAISGAKIEISFFFPKGSFFPSSVMDFFLKMALKPGDLSRGSTALALRSMISILVPKHY